MEVFESKKTTKTTRSLKSKWIIWGVVVLIIGLFIGSAFYINHIIANQDKFYDNTTINGIHVGNLSSNEATNVISSALASKQEDIKITLVYNDKTWEWSGSDFEVNSNILPIVEQAKLYGRNGNIFQKLSTIKNIQKNGYNTDISYKFILAGLDEKINKVCQEINTSAKEPNIKFVSENKYPFEVSEGKNGISVNTKLLFENIDKAFSSSPKIRVEIPTITITPTTTKSEVLSNLVLRSSFKTSYENSIAERKSNIKTALSKFNGLKIEPEQEISFNQTTGSRTKENGYKKANIILNGLFVEGSGGGVCQASTTLYNALLEADIEITEVNKHSLPVSYVPLAFDAMVSEGFSDLKFKNTLSHPVYIKSWGDNTTAYVEIYGQPFENGIQVIRRAEFIKTIPHSGDTIIKDTKGEYTDKVLYKGEYYRLKSPHEGYQSRAYIDYIKDGQTVSSKLIRDEIYEARQGVIVEGIEELGEGMSVPNTSVKIIPPQTSNINQTQENIENKIKQNNPTKFNP